MQPPDAGALPMPSMLLGGAKKKSVADQRAAFAAAAAALMPSPPPAPAPPPPPKPPIAQPILAAAPPPPPTERRSLRARIRGRQRKARTTRPPSSPRWVGLPAACDACERLVLSERPVGRPCASVGGSALGAWSHGGCCGGGDDSGAGGCCHCCGGQYCRSHGVGCCCHSQCCARRVSTGPGACKREASRSGPDCLR